MTQFDHLYLQQIMELELPTPSDAVITHGSALVVRGVRPAHAAGDVDMVTTRQNIDYLAHRFGWKETARQTPYDGDATTRMLSPDKRFDIYNQDFSLLQHQATGNGRVDLATIKCSSQQDAKTGIWVASLEFVRQTKQETGRAKDKADIDRIDAFGDVD